MNQNTLQNQLSLLEFQSNAKTDQVIEIYSTDIEELTRVQDNNLDLVYIRPKINDFRRINQYFITVNQKLKNKGYLVCQCETLTQRNNRLKIKYGKFYVVYKPLDFVYKRVIPKLTGIKKIYFEISDGKNRVLSKAEVLGRLYYCGFELVKMDEIDNRLHLIMKKTKPPCNDPQPSYGPLFKMKRVGKDGNIIHTFKFRTMHPYSEYLRDYMLQQNGYSLTGDGIGKIDNDFRVTEWGKFLRKNWLDELPQFINIFRGELKLVGVRPISSSFVKEYPEDFLKDRLQYKPGLFPPYAAHIHKSVAEYIESEKKYLAAYKKSPIVTDIKYFLWIVFNILSHKIRSQ
ncbi:MAG TPA: sugar transferase [bacterium]|nr:sugar transferase [bacterium]HPN42145.1 sugar transferase [bacterium]